MKAPAAAGDDELIFAATRGSGMMTGFPSLWARIVKLGGLPVAITPHVARHSFASLAGDLGYSEPTIAALVGHEGRTDTVHSADAVLLAAADAVANRTALMGEPKQPDPACRAVRPGHARGTRDLGDAMCRPEPGGREIETAPGFDCVRAGAITAGCLATPCSNSSVHTPLAGLSTALLTPIAFRLNVAASYRD